MTTAAPATTVPPVDSNLPAAAELFHTPADSLVHRALRSGRVVIGGGAVLLILLACVVTLPWTMSETSRLFYDRQTPASRFHPSWATSATERVAAAKLQLGPILGSFGYDNLGRSILARCLMGGCISLAIGVAAAAISITLGVTVGLVAGYRGGWVDSALMRFVDILYGLPYILLVILFKIAFEKEFTAGRWFPILLVLGLIATVLIATWVLASLVRRRLWRAVVRVAVILSILAIVILSWGKLRDFVSTTWLMPMSGPNASMVVMFLAIGLVSWLTMARVVRGQVLSLRGQPFIEAARAMGLPSSRIFLRHILPNLVGPVIVYATLTVPQAILQESFLSFLGVGVNPPLPTWGSLASDALLYGLNPVSVYWWMLVFPCTLLAVTLLSLNFMGDGLRDIFDPKRDAAKI